MGTLWTTTLGTHKLNNKGCNGGYDFVVFDYVSKNGLASDSSYSYAYVTYFTGSTWYCKSFTSSFKNTGYKFITP